MLCLHSQVLLSASRPLTNHTQISISTAQTIQLHRRGQTTGQIAAHKQTSQQIRGWLNKSNAWIHTVTENLHTSIQMVVPFEGCPIKV